MSAARRTGRARAYDRPCPSRRTRPATYTHGAHLGVALSSRHRQKALGGEGRETSTFQFGMFVEFRLDLSGMFFDSTVPPITRKTLGLVCPPQDSALVNAPRHSASGPSGGPGRQSPNAKSRFREQTDLATSLLPPWMTSGSRSFLPFVLRTTLFPRKSDHGFRIFGC